MRNDRNDRNSNDSDLAVWLFVLWFLAATIGAYCFVYLLRLAEVIN